MSISMVKGSVITFYRSCNKPTFWFACVVLWQLMAFLPSMPSMVVYGVYIAYALYVLFHSSNLTFYKPLLVFLLYVPVQLMLVAPDSSFHCWDRFVLFVLLLICVSPLLNNLRLAKNRRTIFSIALTVCTFLGVGSFFARFLGINYGTSRTLDNILQIGTFGGLTHHSMLLGPVAAVGCVFCCWMGYTRRIKIYWCLGVLCITAVMFSASRSALVGAIAAITMCGTSVLSLAACVRDSDRSPHQGLRFDALDLTLSSASGAYDKDSGMVESGSSWLIILSMTGLIGAILLFPVLFGTYRQLWFDSSPQATILLGLLTFFFVHMIAEGYIFYGGSMLAFLLWLTIGVSRDFLQYRLILINCRSK